jgi:hypothetical protein
MLLQNPDDLLFRVSALLHRQLPRLDYERTPVPTGRDFRGQVNCPVICLGLLPSQSMYLLIDIEFMDLDGSSWRRPNLPRTCRSLRQKTGTLPFWDNFENSCIRPKLAFHFYGWNCHA